jgi:hypothetical protein
MLQQTRVAQGLPYFLSFTETFPTIFDLANAEEEQVLKLWQGLGYYSRARNMHKTAQIVAFEFDGKFPENYNDLIKLKGIGEYTAAAIASFAFNEVVPVVDGNVSHNTDQGHLQAFAHRSGHLFPFLFQLDKLDFDQFVVVKRFVDGTHNFFGNAELANMHDGLQRVRFPG